MQVISAKQGRSPLLSAGGEDRSPQAARADSARWFLRRWLLFCSSRISPERGAFCVMSRQLNWSQNDRRECFRHSPDQFPGRGQPVCGLQSHGADPEPDRAVPSVLKGRRRFPPFYHSQLPAIELRRRVAGSNSFGPGRKSHSQTSLQASLSFALCAGFRVRPGMTMRALRDDGVAMDECPRNRPAMPVFCASREEPATPGAQENRRATHPAVHIKLCRLYERYSSTVIV